jgi:hypothetical protein
MGFDEFVSFIFERPDDHREWYFDPELVNPELNADTAVQFSSRVFSDIQAYTNQFTEGQLSLGLNYLINPSCSSYCYSFLDNSVSERSRSSAIASMYDVFKYVFTRIASEIPSHNVHTPPYSYNYICYMWWDVFPRHGIPMQRDLKRIDEVILETLRNILLLDSIACKESALHGLGHWHAAYPEFVEQIIDSMSPGIPVQLKKFARNARAGSVQ